MLREIREALPHADLLYVADYGEQSPEFILARAQTITRFLLDQGAKAIVIACNTVTAAAVRALRETLDVPIGAMESASFRRLARNLLSSLSGANSTHLRSTRVQRVMSLH